MCGEKVTFRIKSWETGMHTYYETDRVKFEIETILVNYLMGL